MNVKYIHYTHIQHTKQEYSLRIKCRNVSNCTFVCAFVLCEHNANIIIISDLKITDPNYKSHIIYIRIELGIIIENLKKHFPSLINICCAFSFYVPIYI